MEELGSETAEVEWGDYLVFGAVLLGSMSIGTYYGFFGTRQKSTKEYLQANRQMSYFPVSISIICSAVSAVSFIGNPTEIYFYGTQLLVNLLAFIPLTLSLAYLYVPVYFNVNVNSSYEYIELRFNSKVRIVVSLLSVVDVVIGMAVAIYAPSLAIEQITGINRMLTAALLYFICIFYSILGGLKGVLWTDVLQAGIMLASLLAIFIKGISDLGGFDIVWQRAIDGGRIEFTNFDPDPRVRHTVWTSIIGGYFFSMPFYSTSQMQVQRYLSVPNITTARKALLVNFVGVVLIVGLTFSMGLVIFAEYYNCDPLTTEVISKSDQLLPDFAARVSKGVPGLLGLFIAGLTSASLSSLSSGLTALASITTYDYVNKLFPDLSDTKLSLISKVNTLILAMISFSFVFAIDNMGNILQMMSSFIGILSGPIFGLFTLGMFFPWANSKGVTLGLFTTFPLMIIFIVGTIINSSEMPDQKLPLSTEGCENNITTAIPSYTTSPTGYFVGSETTSSNWKDDDDSLLIQLLSVSYMFYSMLGCLTMLTLGTAYSFIVSYFYPETIKLVDSTYISPPILAMWNKVLSPKRMEQWIQTTRENEGVLSFNLDYGTQ